MKYLGIHKIIWAILVILPILMDMIGFVVFHLCYLIWNLKFINDNLWREMHTGETWTGHKYSDYNPLETFIRYYKHPFGSNYDEMGYPK